MGRLTWKKEDGTWGLINADIKKCPREFYGALCKLKDYEETGLDPDKIAEIDELYLEKCREIEEYKNIGSIEECRAAVEVKKEITEVVNRQLIAGRNNYKETNNCFYEIAKIIQDNY